MEKEFVPYELSVKLKEIGFNEHCIATYDEDKNFELQDFFQTYETFPSHIISAPTFSQAFLFVMQFPQIKKYRYNVALYSDATYSLKEGKDTLFEYLSAESCLDKLIEIVEQKEK